MMELVEPPMPECKEKRGKPDYLQCFRRAMRWAAAAACAYLPLPTRVGRYLMSLASARRERFDRLLDLPKHLPIRVFFPGQGFWRDYVGDTVVEPGAALLKRSAAHLGCTCGQSCTSYVPKSAPTGLPSSRPPSSSWPIFAPVREPNQPVRHLQALLSNLCLALGHPWARLEGL